MRSVCWQKQCNKECGKERMGSAQDPFKEQSGQKPPGSIVQPDNPPDMKTAPEVIPGAEIMLPQEAPAEIFRGEDHGHIEQTTPRTTYVQPLKKALERRQQAGRAVDGEHPQGSAAYKPQIPAFQGMQGGKQDLHAPAAQSAQQKVPAEGF